MDLPRSSNDLPSNADRPAAAAPAEPPRHGRLHRGRTPKGYDACDGISEGLLYCMVVFGPWAFGTTQVWSTWVMNGVGYALGALLVAKWVIRWRAGYPPVRWGESGERSRRLTRALAILTVVMLGYCLVAAVNARATFNFARRYFDFHRCLEWLPHSYDSSSTWFAFCEYLGLACVFWSARDWLLGKTRRERRGAGPPPSSLEPASASGLRLPARLQRFLWVICLNGSLLALESILQRVSGTNKLLWLVLPYWNRTAESQFGPFAYRANAAEYFNLVWPVCLGFWWTLRSLSKGTRNPSVRLGSNPRVILLPGAVLMAASPVISTTRGGAAVAAGLWLGAIALLLVDRHGTRLHRAGVVSLFLVIVALAGYLGWKELAQRLKTVFTDDMSGRVEIYKNAQEMTREFVWLGSGPNTFSPLYQEYRSDPTQTWEAWAHDDWLEFRITFGRLGGSGLLALLLLVLGRWFVPGGFHLPRTAVRMIWLALAGCLVHARFDFPLQVYSILFVFILWCSLLSCVSRQA